MVKIAPFRALRYNDSKDLSAVTAPPYDVIDETLQQSLYDQDPANCIRLILGKENTQDSDKDNVYTRAKGFLTDWQQDSLLQPDDKPCLYAYSQTFDGTERKGLIALVKIEEYETKQVLPHEKTIAKYIADRRDLTKTCMANLSPIFFLYSDPEKLVETSLFTESGHWAKATDPDNTLHKIKTVSDESLIQPIQKMFSQKNALIADGHHRYQTALTIKREAREAYKAQHGSEPADGSLLTDYWMVFFSNMDDEGLVVYPTHRLLKSWPADWNQEKFIAALKSEFEVIADKQFAIDEQTFQAKFPNGTVLTLKPKNSNPFVADVHPELLKLDVTHIDKIIVEGLFQNTAQNMKQDKSLFFDRDDANSNQLVSNGTMVCGLFTHAPSVHQVKAICEAGELMPQKSTYFYPKILTGLTFYSYIDFINSNGHALTNAIEKPVALEQNLFSSPQPVTAG